MFRAQNPKSVTEPPCYFRSNKGNVSAISLIFSRPCQVNGLQPLVLCNKSRKWEELRRVGGSIKGECWVD